MAAPQAPVQIEIGYKSEWSVIEYAGGICEHVTAEEAKAMAEKCPGIQCWIITAVPQIYAEDLI